MAFLKSRWFWAVVAVLVLGGGWYVYGKNASKGPFYETQTVEKGTVRQTVDVTGQVTPDNRLDLAFKSGGLIERISVKPGDAVKKGQIIAVLDTRDLQFSVRRAAATIATAQANLAARAAGETKESIQITQASLDQAQANLKKSQTDLEITRISVEDEYRVSQLAVINAQQNYDNANSSNDQTIKNGFESLKTTLQGSLGYVQTALTDGDRIIGVDNSIVNDKFEYLLTFSDALAFERSKIRYAAAKLAYREGYAQIQVLGPVPTEASVRTTALKTRESLEKTLLFLDDILRVLGTVLPTADFTTTEITSKKSQIEAGRISVSAQLAALNTSLQTITNAELARTTNLDQLRNALETAKANLAIADRNRVTKVKTAETNVVLQQAAVASAKAALDQKKAGPRAVDLAPLRAQIFDAQTAYAQAVDRLRDTEIVAPVDGIVADVLPKVGEQIAPNANVIALIGDQGYTIEALIPEGDISKVQVGQPVTLTLESYRDDVVFTGAVISENPDQTKVQDAIYYKVHIGIDKKEGTEVKPGMTANIIILTSERKDVLFTTNRAIREGEDKKTVRILKQGQAVEAVVQVGLRGDEGRLEIVSGVTEEHAALEAAKK
jgi:multidrug efflux pump subunit AcrA (membrane-fusion protein)